MKTTKRMPTSFRLDERILADLRALGQEKGLKYTEIVRLAVAEFLEKQKQAGLEKTRLE